MDYSKLSDDIIKNALHSYSSGSKSSIDEKIQINAWIQSEDNGDFSISVDELNQSVKCIYETKSGDYERLIPKQYSDIKSDVYPYGEIKFESVNLISISILGGFSWTTETFKAMYLGKISSDSIEEDQKYLVLTQYYPPRKILSESPEFAVESDDDKIKEFMISKIKQSVYYKEPNPWAFCSFGVLYENSKYSNKLLELGNNYMDYSEQTPPESLNQPHIELI